MEGAMANGIGPRSWLPRGRLARRTRGFVLGGTWLRLVTRRRAHALDRRLAAGADPMTSDELALRVGQLGSAATRKRLAWTLRDAVELANGRRRPLITTRLRRRAVLESEELLSALADRVGEGEPVGVRGLALAALLVKRSSALYRDDSACPLKVVAFDALIALDDGLMTSPMGVARGPNR
jgi:hypothetical protein